MAFQISKSDAEDALRDHLQALALPGWKQLRLFSVGETKVGLTKSVRTWSRNSTMAALIRSQPQARLEKLDRIRTLAMQVSKAEGDPYIFRGMNGHEECQELRRLAADLLDDYGWPRKTPSKHSPFLFGLPAQQKAKRKQPEAPRWHGLKRTKNQTKESDKLTYHQAVFDLLDLRAEVAKQSENRLRRREKQHELILPASVFELYSLRHISDIFCDNTNQDSLVEFSQLGKHLEINGRTTYLEIATENQGVVTWHVPLDCGDDPPVLQAPDGDFSEAELVSAAFSNFVFDIVSNNCFRGWTTGLHLEGTAAMPDQGLLRKLRRTFQEGPRTRRRNSTVYRLFTTDSVLHIVSNTARDRDSQRGLWVLEATSSEALFEMARVIWDFNDVSQRLKAKSMTDDTKAVGKSVLRQLRKLR